MKSAKNPYTVPVASDEPVYEIDSFEMLWEQHKGMIIAGVVAFIAIIAAVFGWLIYSNAQATAATAAYGAAKTAADYRAIVEKYPSSPLAGDASLLLAASLRAEKKYDEANQVLDHFVKTQPRHPLAPLAKVAAAINTALAGKVDAAEDALGAVAQTDSKSFVAPFALIIEAEMKSAQGHRQDALKTYIELSRTFPESIATRAAAPTLQSLESMEPVAASQQPMAPVPPAP
ncbi:MAG: tetratricopeptide repeat protein [Chthoniobacterales bacterium]